MTNPQQQKPAISTALAQGVIEPPGQTLSAPKERKVVAVELDRAWLVPGSNDRAQAYNVTREDMRAISFELTDRGVFVTNVKVRDSSETDPDGKTYRVTTTTKSAVEVPWANITGVKFADDVDVVRVAAEPPKEKAA